MCSVMLYRGGGYQSRDDAYSAATELTMEEATALVSNAKDADTAGE